MLVMPLQASAFLQISRIYFVISIGMVLIKSVMMISIDHNPDDIFSVENEIV